MYPVAFRIGSLVVYWYGVMLVLAYLAGELLVLWLARREQVELDRVLFWMVSLLLGGIVGARLAGLVRDSLTGGQIASPLVREGFVSYGAPVGVLVAGWVYARVARLSLWRLLDLAAPSVALGFAITRIGCFLNGCCYGRPTGLPWGVRFPASSPAGLAFGDTPLHPAQIYASLGNLALLGVLLALHRRRRFEGFTFLWWVVLYAVLRFLLEFARAGPRVALGLTTAQLANLVIGPAALAVLWAKGRSKRVEN